MGPYSCLLHASQYTYILYEIMKITQSENTNINTNIHSELLKTQELLHRGSSNIPQNIFAHLHF